MTAAFAPGFYTTETDAASVSGDWRLGGWTPKVLQLPEDLGNDARRIVLVELGRALGLGDVASVDGLASALAGTAPQTVLVWARGTEFADQQAGVWKALAEVLEARAKASPAFAVVLAGRDKKSKERDR
ncbi:hypothetical protein ET989_01855 [Propioniciclava sinopodophylli]|uniref:Barstar (barnase inhibitor) domain-containing protein n=1 Tax=Propioniciclava sinopodophylli TaxID=1837344 RepID=A0A4Q9KH73_9ACTN|nr:hypothetical protein [Propioniciclava sinopodophylli]TBT88704.1 hypothetical protein ET989_01855 [Propioniciclava sinopodophylli]